MRRRLYATRGIWAYLQKQKQEQLPLLLDNFSSVAACYSLRKLRTDYSGAAIRVRRSSDNTELDIGFTSTGDLDIVTLLAFVGSGNGFVIIWYDQSGNGRNAAQNTAGAQPQIVSNGVITTHQNKSTLYFDGNDDYFVHTLNLPGESIVTAVVNSFGLLADRVASTVFVAAPPNTQIDNFLSSRMPYITQWGSYANGALSSGISIDNDYSLLEVISNNPPTGLVELYTNGVFSAALAGRYGGDFQTRQTIGAEHSWGGNNHYGYIAEIIAFSSVLSITDRQLIENSQMSYYSILNMLSIPVTELEPFIIASDEELLIPETKTDLKPVSKVSDGWFTKLQTNE